MLFDSGESRAALDSCKVIIIQGFPEGISRTGPAHGGAQAGGYLRYYAHQGTHNGIKTGRLGDLPPRSGSKRKFDRSSSYWPPESTSTKVPTCRASRRAIAKVRYGYGSVCDGYEATDQRIGVLGHGEDASSKAEFLRTYLNDVTLLSLDDKNGETAESLSEAGVKVAGPVSLIEHGGDAIRAVLKGGQTLSFDVVYPALGCGVRSELAVALGARTNDVGCLEVDAHQRTTVDGVYAAGDASYRSPPDRSCYWPRHDW